MFAAESRKRRASVNNEGQLAAKRYHAGALSTPYKNSIPMELSSSPTSEALFSSVARNDQLLMSSPPVAALKRKQVPQLHTPIRLCLNIGTDGKAHIGSLSSPETPPTKVLDAGRAVEEDKENSLLTEVSQIGEKSKILNLLKQMKNGGNSPTKQRGKRAGATAPPVHVPAPAPASPPRDQHPSQPLSPIAPNNSNRLSANYMPHAPATPGSNFNLSYIRTGLTPNISSMDKILFDNIQSSYAQQTPHRTENKNNLRSQLINLQHTLSPKLYSAAKKTSPQTVTPRSKYTGGDPLLMAYDDHWSDIMSQNGGTNVMATPHGSAPTTAIKNSNSMSAFGTPSLKVTEPETPRTQQSNLTTAGVTNSSPALMPNSKTQAQLNTRGSAQSNSTLQCTPLIQQSMAGLLSAKMLPNMAVSPKGTHETPEPIDEFQSETVTDDACTALKQLIYRPS
ncbi:Msa2p KNAG_0C06420 [Huiozyma naganishii CBS 8797]|uniref:Uncharacterized protein n=1 Tax=Huiozyma naganishii (strain ATCC MYA-139 / BCRC 22969 / CBS 8797 / KCTC 17520 / NBRC 10181 / NCYC 3082 / Yp74L-3) TaxID=1071383 RepID=J7R4F8_HUIN7|nr:hypothetical protein KNAG_0C06420 [Kazachstania naganishii CBS 8797]CCK69735.1 hypothetical protein KNAG_0C06420 [Kazachstania naganishii CBS 8797]